MKGIPYHFASHNKQQPEGYPMVDGRGYLLKGTAQKGSQQGKETLEQSQDEGKQQSLAVRHLAFEGAGGGHDKTVDAES